MVHIFIGYGSLESMGGQTMKKTEVECCDVTCVHNQIIEAVKEKMPAEELLNELADFYKVFGDATRIKILCVLLRSEMCACIKADEAGEEQKRRKNSLLFTCGWTYSEYYQPRNGTYYGVVFTGFLVEKEKGK